MHILELQARRRWYFTAVLGILLCFAVGFSVIGVCMWYSAEKQSGEVEENYTTIAVLRQRTSDEIKISDSIYPPDEGGTHVYGDEDQYFRVSDISSVASQSPSLASVARHCLLNAHVPGLTPLSSGAEDELQYYGAFDAYSYNLCVLAVRCIDGEWFEILDAVSRLGAYDLPPDGGMIRLMPRLGPTDLRNFDGVPAFEEGKTYLVRCFYYDYPIIETYDYSEENLGAVIRVRSTWEDYENSPMQWRFRRFELTNTGLCQMSESLSGRSGDARPGDTLTVEYNGVRNFVMDELDVLREDGYYDRYLIPREDDLPFWAEYTGDWRDFLETDDGRVWRDEIIPLCQLNYESAPVLLTDRVDSLYAFSTGECSIMEGRTISREEYASGADVCIISADYASLNGLSVGDSIGLDLYDSGYYLDETVSLFSIFSGGRGAAFSMFPLQNEDRIGVEKEYEIVGIYSGPGFTPSINSVRPDMIIVPKASVPEAGQYEDPDIQFLNSYILKNGTIDEFESYMDGNNMGGYFVCCDMGYEAAVTSLEAIQETAARILTVSTAVFALTAVIYVFLRSRMVSGVVRGMRLLGVGAGRTRREIMGTMALWTFIAAAAGLTAGGALFGTVTSKVLSDAMTMDWPAGAVCATAELALLLFLEYIVSFLLPRRRLMQRRGGR